MENNKRKIAEKDSFIVTYLLCSIVSYFELDCKLPVVAYNRAFFNDLYSLIILIKSIPLYKPKIETHIYKGISMSMSISCLFLRKSEAEKKSWLRFAVKNFFYEKISNPEGKGKSFMKVSRTPKRKEETLHTTQEDTMDEGSLLKRISTQGFFISLTRRMATCSSVRLKPSMCRCTGKPYPFELYQ